jgi:hypothetical protein
MQASNPGNLRSSFLPLFRENHIEVYGDIQTAYLRQCGKAAPRQNAGFPVAKAAVYPFAPFQKRASAMDSHEIGSVFDFQRACGSNMIKGRPTSTIVVEEADIIGVGFAGYAVKKR